MHTNTLLMKLKQNTNLLKVGNKFLNKASKKMVYYAHIYSDISYGTLVWGNMIDNTIKNKIHKCMYVCFNLITHQPPTQLNYKKEKMLRLNELKQLENSKLCHKLQYKLLPTRLHTMLLSDSKRQSLVKRHKYLTRTKNIPKLPSIQTKQYHTSFQFQSINEYENLSPD